MLELIAMGLVMVIAGIVAIGVSMIIAAIGLIGTISSAATIVLAIWLAILAAKKIYEAWYANKHNDP